MSVLVIYHANCADGFGAAFVAWNVLGSEGVEYRPMTYGTPFDMSGVEDKEVYILDFSLDKQTMLGIMECARKTVWIDHHLTAFQMWCGGMPDKEWHFENRDCTEDNPNGKTEIRLDNQMSGALLTWKYFYPTTQPPRMIRHIDDYDRWQFQIEGTRAFNKALWSYAPWTFEQWQKFFVMNIDEYRMFIAEGRAIQRSHEQNVQAVVKGASRNCWIRKPFYDSVYPGLAANCPPHLTSDVGHALATQSGTFGLLWYINKDGLCLCSLRSNGDYNVAEIAKEYSGGGHKNAAGFQVEIRTLLEWIK